MAREKKGSQSGYWVGSVEAQNGAVADEVVAAAAAGSWRLEMGEEEEKKLEEVSMLVVVVVMMVVPGANVGPRWRTGR